MLILTRKIDERLVIGEDVFLSILDVKGRQVRIGIEAPKDVMVHREEIFLKIKAQQNMMYTGGSELDRRLTQALRSHQKLILGRQATH